MWRSKPMLAVSLLTIAVAACTSSAPAGDDTTTAPPTTTTVGSTTSSIAATTTSSTTTTTSTVATTTSMSSTTTTTSPATTTTTTSSPTTTTVPSDNQAPSVQIISPEHLSAHTASYDPQRKDFGAFVSLSAIVDDPDGDPVTVRWTSSQKGTLGEGDSIVAFISTDDGDTSQPFITATATDRWGASDAATVQIIVWIPSDTGS